MAIQQGYKVVCVLGDKRLASIFIFNEGTVIYTPGQWATPSTNPLYTAGPLSVFETIKHAATFLKRPLSAVLREVWKCEYEPSEEKQVWFGLWEWLPERVDALCLPPGTRLANRVRLLECVSACGRGPIQEISNGQQG